MTQQQITPEQVPTTLGNTTVVDLNTGQPALQASASTGNTVFSLKALSDDPDHEFLPLQISDVAIKFNLSAWNGTTFEIDYGASQKFLAIGYNSPDEINLGYATGKVGFFGTAGIARPQVPATPTAQDVVDVLVALGLITQAA